MNYDQAETLVSNSEEIVTWIKALFIVAVIVGLKILYPDKEEK